MPRYHIVRREWSRQDFAQDIDASTMQEAIDMAYMEADEWVATSDLETVRTELIDVHEVPGA